MGQEFRVNTYTFDNQQWPTVGVDAEGDFVIAWSGPQQDEPGYSSGVFAQRFASSGARLGVELQVNSYTPASQYLPSLAMEDNGDFVVAWTSRDQDGAGNGVFAQRFSSDGGALGGEFQVSTFTSSDQEFPVVASDADGDFVVTWTGRNQEYGKGVLARRFSSTGGPLGEEFRVNSYTQSDQYGSRVDIDEDGDFVVTWTSLGHQDGLSAGIFAQRFSSAGDRAGVELQVNSYTSDDQFGPAIALDADGDFVIAWVGRENQDGSGYGLFAQRFASAGQRIASEFQVNTATAYNQNMLAMAADDAGMLEVFWIGGGVLTNPVLGQRYSNNGARMGGEFQVNTYTPYQQPESPAVGMTPDGDFVVAWHSNHDGGGNGIFAQRFVRYLLDVDGDGSVEALTDGLLVLRNQFGFGGEVLVGGVVDLANCTRCTAGSIQAYLGTLGSHLDIDASGSQDPLSDGLMVLRYLFGFRGATLVSGTIAFTCKRCTAAAVADHLQRLAD